MELFLVVPLKEGEGKGKDDKDVEELDGKLWTLSYASPKPINRVAIGRWKGWIVSTNCVTLAD